MKDRQERLQAKAEQGLILKNVFVDWGEFEYKDIHDVSFCPFLDRIDSVFAKLCDANRREMKLGAVLSVASHLLREVYHCPANINLFIMSFMPTGTGKERYIQTIASIMEVFNCGSHVFSDMDSYQGFFNKLKMNDGSGFSLIDEISETFKGLMSTRANIKLEQVKKAIKIISTGGTLYSHVSAQKDIEVIKDAFLSIFWSGTEHAFKHLQAHDFHSGMLGRFMFFLLKEEKKEYTGIRGREEHEKADIKISAKTIEQFWPLDMTFNFGDKINFPDFFYEWSDAFANLLDEKQVIIGGSEEMRSSLLVRAVHNMKKVATLTCHSKGVVSEQGIRWATGVVIHSLKNAVYLTDKHFDKNKMLPDIKRITQALLSLPLEKPDNKVSRRSLTRKSSIYHHISRKRIEVVLKQLSDEGKIEEVQEPNSRSNLKVRRMTRYIYLLPALYDEIKTK